MDIKDKLAYYRSNSQKEESKKHTDIPPSLKALIEQFGAEICQQSAPYLKISKSYKTDFLNENDIQSINLTFLSKGEFDKDIHLKDCLFFDLETTGLAGGSGTLAFLIGFARFDNGNIIVDQYFLPDYGREYYAFKEINEWANNFSHLISYNGRSFDLPLLKSRFIMNHIQLPFNKMEHVDLLHFARRIWKDTLSTCDLISVEANFLNRQRNGDIPGWQIPQAYFNYIRTGAIHEIIQIIEHNYLDLISLAELLLFINKIEQNPHKANDLNSLIRLAGLAFAGRDQDTFNKLYAEFPESQVNKFPKLLLWKSLLHKHNCQWEEAVLIWEELTQSKEISFFAFEELAKYYEHEIKDFTKAMHYTKRALDKIEMINQLEYAYKYLEEKKSFLYRHKRLVSKLS